MRLAADAELRRLSNVKQSHHTSGQLIGPEMVQFFKHSVEKRQTKFGKVAEAWGALVPEMFNDHCALEGFSRGTLNVLVDSSSHLYELKQLLLAGLQQQILFACKSTGLRKINLRAGRWYESDGDDRKVSFRH
jgi:hypothetical protein